MFSTLAKLAIRCKIPIVVIWIAVTLALVIFAPSLSEVGVTDDTQFLPRNTESTQAVALLRENFASSVDEPVGSVLIVVYNPQGLTQADNQTALNLRDWLVSPQAPSIITRVISVFDNQALQSALVSQDQTTLLLNLELAKASSSAPSREAVSTIRTHIQGLHSSTRIYVTGPAGVSTDILTSIKDTINKATLVTIVLVIFLLLLIYRSPIAIFVPLITIGVSYLVARGITGYLAAYVTNVSSLVDAYLVVTLFGIGTDYCLFTVSRFKEEMVQGDRKQALELAIKHIGPVILASATTVVVALLCLGISQFGNSRTSGYILAIGVAITLLAGLTLTPALIALFGKILLWPAKLTPDKRTAGIFWNRIGRQITDRPQVFIIPIVILLALPYLALPKINYSANLLSQIPQTLDSTQGYNTLKAHFATGELNPLNVIVKSPGANLTAPASLADIANLSESLQKVPQVSRVRYFASPTSQLTVSGQQSQSIGNNLSLTTLNQLNFFQTLSKNMQNLAVEYPGITRSSNFQQISSDLMSLSMLTGQIQPSTSQNIPGIITQIKPLILDIAAKLQSLAGEFNLQTDSPFSQWLRSSYFSQDGTLTRLDVILKSDPYAKESINAVSQVREATGSALKAANLNGATYYVGGLSADQEDILAVNASDFLKVLALAIVGILLVTAILLRSLVAPLYMIMTVLFNFGATLGIATWLFLNVLQQGSMIYMLPIFVFVILIAVGSDYNIFLVSRIREEAFQSSLKEAICTAVANTGGVITSCGIILAGTFGALTTASLQMVFQVGAAIGTGVLIDTFLVRAVLIPSLATVFQRWNWWPSRLFRAK